MISFFSIFSFQISDFIFQFSDFIFNFFSSSIFLNTIFFFDKIYLGEGKKCGRKQNILCYFFFVELECWDRQDSPSATARSGKCQWRVVSISWACAVYK